MRVLLLLTLLFFLREQNCLLAQSFSLSNSRYGGYLYLSVVSDPKSFNPILAQETSTTTVTNLIFEGLTRINAVTLEPEPNLASSWEMKQEGRVWIFHLRKNVRWNDGEPFTADDVVFTFNKLIYNPDIPSSASDILKVEDKPFQVEKIDAYSVKFTLPSTYAPFLMAMTQEILPEHKLKKIVEAGRFNTVWTLASQPEEIVGTGPFMLKKYIPGQLIQLVRNPYYWKKDEAGNPLPYLDGIKFVIVQNIDTALLLFLSGEIDYYSLRGQDYAILKPREKQGNFKIYQLGPAYGSNFLVFNQNPGADPKTGKPYLEKRKLNWFREKKFRQAISFALDRKSMIEIVLNGFGYPQYGPMSPSSGYFFNPKIKKYPYSPQLAKKLLQEIGLEDRDGDGILEDNQGKEVEFSLYTNAENSERVKIAEVIKKDLADIGVKVHFLPLEFNTLVSKLLHNYDWEAIMIGLTGGIEPHFGSNVWLSSAHLHAWYPKQKEPATSWEKEIDSIFTQAVQILDRARRKKLYDRWQELVSEELPFIYTVLPESMFALRNRFGNLKPTPYGSAFHNIEEIYLLKN